MSRLEKINALYAKYERHLSSFALFAGFVFDIVVLKRIDMPTENIWIIGHLLIALVGILILNRYYAREAREPSLYRPHYWLLVMVQFAFGGLLSTFLVFYFRSSMLVESWPFLLTLFVAFAANELLKERYSLLTFQVSYFFLSTYLFMVYFVPIVLGQIGDTVFILSGLISVLITQILLMALSRIASGEYNRSKWPIAYSVCGILAIVNILYFSNVIPPIPLSLKASGVYHSIERNADGNYAVEYEEQGQFGPLSRYQVFHHVKDEPIYIYSAVFSPTNLNTDIVHDWQYYDAESETWVTSNRIELPVVGGREGGYRTYSVARAIVAGYWRVNVETSSGLIIGRINFEIIDAVQKPVLTSGINL